MKNKRWPLLGLIVFFTACNASYVPVLVELHEKDSIGLDRFEQVYFIDFVQHLSEKNYDPQEQIRRYFIYDFAAAIGRKIVTLTLPDWDRIRMASSPEGFSFPGAVFFRKLLAAYPKALFLTGQLEIDVKTTSIIQEVHDDQGKRKNAFVSKQLWNADAQVVLIESDSGKIVVEKSHSEKTTIEDLFALRYQLGLLLDRLGDKLLPDLQKKKRFQERYILR